MYADKGYSSQGNRYTLVKKHLINGIMEKAHRDSSLTEAQKQRNNILSKARYVIEQSFGTLHRKFRHSKAICLNLLKGANRMRMPAIA